MIRHYHGTPIWGDAGSVHKIAVRGAGACVSHYRPDQLRASLEYAESVMLDNGAYSFWTNEEKPDWKQFYEDLDKVYNHPRLTFFIIPDIITGTEEENDAMVRALPPVHRDKAAPCWHLHESIDRLLELCRSWPRVYLGSSGQYAVIRTKMWHARMHEALRAIGNAGLRPHLHGLRMLDGRIFGNYPLTTADSTNLACNVPKYKVKYPQLTANIVEADYAQGLDAEELKRLILRNRCAVLKGTIEAVKPPTLDDWLDALCVELEAQGYLFGASVLPAAGIGAAHKRERLFFGAADWMADANSNLHRGPIAGSHELSYGAAQGHGAGILVAGQPGGAGGAVRGPLADAHHSGQRADQGSGGSGWSAGQGNDSGRSGIISSVADANSLRLQGVGSDRYAQRWEGSYFRQDGLCDRAGVDWYACRDGKARPVEPGTMPLVDGIPKGLGRGESNVYAMASRNRNLRLKGYGNAIHPLVAAQYILAFEKSLTEVVN